MELLRFERDPFAGLARLQDEMNRLFESYGPFAGHRRGGQEHVSARVWQPLADVYEDQDRIVLHFDLPGLRQEDIDIEMTGDTLTIKGERRFEDEQRRDNYVRVERAYGQFQRTFTIGVPIQQDGVSAAYKNGVLEVTLPKAEETKPKKVRVSAQ